MRALAFASVAWLASAGFASAQEAAVEVEPVTSAIQRGPVEVILQFSPPEPVIGDELELRLEAIAEPDVELLMPEFGEALDRFQILDFTQRSSVDTEGRTHEHQTYVLASPMSGKHRLPPLLIEFVDRRPDKPAAPEGEDAFEVLTERIDFEVESVLPEGAIPDLPPPPGELAALDAPTARLGWLAAGLLGVLALLGFFAFRRWQEGRTLARQRSAHEVAESRLQTLLAQGIPEGDAIDPFYVELSGIVRTYLEDRFELRSPELTSEEFFEVARSSPDLSPELRELVREFLHRADLVKFARHVPGQAETEAAVASVRDVLEQTRQRDEEEAAESQAPEAALA